VTSDQDIYVRSKPDKSDKPEPKKDQEKPEKDLHEVPKPV
jgi:hypothetical protein